MNEVLGTKLPQHWEASRLKHVTSFLNRGTAPNYVENGPVRAISQASNQLGGIDWDRTRFHAYDGDARKLRGYLHSNDILINSTGTGTLGRVGYFEEAPDGTPCMADGHVTIARASDGELDSRFAYYWLSSSPFYGYIYAALAVGATNQIELSRERLGDAPIPLPPLDEQRRIADFLDAETARIDGIAHLQKNIQEGIEERTSSVLEDTLIANLLEHTRKTPLGRLTEQNRPIMYGIVLPGPNVEEGVPIVKGGDVVAGRMKLDSLNKTTREIEDRYKRSRLKEDDLVIAIRGSVGEVSSVPAEIAGANITQDVARIAPADEVDRNWLKFVLQTPTVAQDIQSRITGATIRGINIWDLQRVLIPTPPFGIQYRVAKKAEHIIDLHLRLVNSINRQLELLAERRQALIIAAVTGQIDVTTARGVEVP